MFELNADMASSFADALGSQQEEEENTNTNTLTAANSSATTSVALYLLRMNVALVLEQLLQSSINVQQYVKASKHALLRMVHTCIAPLESINVQVLKDERDAMDGLSQQRQILQTMTWSNNSHNKLNSTLISSWNLPPFASRHLFNALRNEPSGVG